MKSDVYQLYILLINLTVLKLSFYFFYYKTMQKDNILIFFKITDVLYLYSSKCILLGYLRNYCTVSYSGIDLKRFRLKRNFSILISYLWKFFGCIHLLK